MANTIFKNRNVSKYRASYRAKVNRTKENSKVEVMEIFGELVGVMEVKAYRESNEKKDWRAGWDGSASALALQKSRLPEFSPS